MFEIDNNNMLKLVIANQRIIMDTMRKLVADDPEQVKKLSDTIDVIEFIMNGE